MDASTDDDHIWWGPIASERQAREIIAWAAWSLLILGLAPGVALAMAAANGELQIGRPFYANVGDNWYVLGQGAFMTVETGAAVLLLRRQSWVSALVLLLCCVFVITLLASTILRLVTTQAPSLGAAGEYTVLIVCLLFFAHLIWRAMTAAQALRRIATLETFS